MSVLRRPVRKAISAFLLMSTACAERHVATGGEQRPVPSRREPPRENVTPRSAGPNNADTDREALAAGEAAPEPSRTSSRRDTERATGARDPPPEPSPQPVEVEGDVLSHCAFGPPNYGEDSTTD